MSDPLATEIKVRSKSRLLEVCFADGSRFELPFEYLRVHSPSAEVKGHGPGQEVLVLGKENVGVRRVEPIGQYAVRIVFDDGHDTGLFTWRYLHELGRDQAVNWARYQERRSNAAAPPPRKEFDPAHRRSSPVFLQNTKAARVRSRRRFAISARNREGLRGL